MEMSTKRAPIHVLLRSEQSAGVVSVIESGTPGINQATGGGDLHDRELQRTSAHAGLRGSGHGARRKASMTARRRGKVV
jgi:hypothetical protein